MDRVNIVQPNKRVLLLSSIALAIACIHFISTIWLIFIIPNESVNETVSLFIISFFGLLTHLTGGIFGTGIVLILSIVIIFKWRDQIFAKKIAVFGTLVSFTTINLMLINVLSR